MLALRVTKSFIGALVCVLGSTAVAGPAIVQDADGTWRRSEHSCGTQHEFVVNPSAKLVPPAVGLRTVYLNRFGGTYTGGNPTNAAANVSPLAAPTATVPSLDGGFDWPFISQCVRDHFERFNVRIVETEPTSGTYIEAVVGGDGTELGFQSGQLLGIASADNFCNVTERGIAFSFSEAHRGLPRIDEELCATIAHEIGHLIALEHEQLATDLLSYVLIANSNTKAFVDQASGCGTSPQQPQACTCSTGSTNSAMRLGQFIGLKPTETVPPTLDLSAPGATVPPVFEVVANATDDVAMSDVVVALDDEEVGVDFEPEGSTYRIRVANVAEGNYMLAAIARDTAGNVARKEIAITVRKSATGETCIANEACEGGLCAVLGDQMFCTQACDPAASTCPGGFECVESATGGGLCVAESGGCCSATGDPRTTMLFVFGLGVLLLRRRR